jgi:low affinity Fe/Cu permease
MLLGDAGVIERGELRQDRAFTRQENGVSPMKSNMPIGRASANQNQRMNWFESLASKTAILSGKPLTFLLAASVVIVWGISGPVFGYSDTWQLVINTGTTIVTFLMVFLIQNTQTRDTTALQLKLDELILATQGAHNALAGIEEASDEELVEAKEDVRRRCDPTTPDVPDSGRIAPQVGEQES